MLLDHDQTANDPADSQHATPKTGFYPAADEHTQSERCQAKSAELIFTAHKNTPCIHCMQGVFVI